jgi:DNA replication protein DnaC
MRLSEHLKHLEITADDTTDPDDRDAELQAEYEAASRADALEAGRAKIPPRFRHVILDEPLPAGGLFLTGGVGAGKTHAAAATALAAAAEGERIAWVNVPARLAATRTSFNGGPEPQTPAAIARASVVVLDDLGAERPTAWAQEALYELINAIYEADCRLIVTSNLKFSQIARTLGERIASRLVEVCTVVPLDGPDRRRASAARKPGAE